MGIIENIDLAKAYRRVDTDRRDDAWPDIVGYRDYKKNLDENLRALQDRLLLSNRYQTIDPSAIDLPKRGFTLRPGIVPQIDDRIAYQAIADIFASHFQPESNVYSNRLAGNNSNFMFKPGVELWIEFQNKVEEYCHEYSYVVETDVTAYFDHVNHKLLMSKLTDLFATTLEINTLTDAQTILQKMLKKWSRNDTQDYGIPQINDASSFMGNVYLDELDKWFGSHRIVALRYVDDMRLFAYNEPQARKLLSELIVQMRRMGLYVASGKTRIKPVSEVLDELSKGRCKIREIEADIDSGDRKRMVLAANNLGDIFTNMVNNPTEFDDRLFRFCVNRFKRLYVSELGTGIYDKVIHEVLIRLSSMPESTDIFVDYLSSFTTNEEIQTSVMDFLESPYSIYPWQTMQLMELLIRCELSPSMRQRVNQFACRISSAEQHPACRTRAYVLRGKNGTYADRRDIRAQYSADDYESVRRGIIVALQEMKTGERDYFYRNIVTDSRSIHQVVGYIQALPEPTYDYYNPPRPYEVTELYDDSDDLHDLGSECFS